MNVHTYAAGKYPRAKRRKAQPVDVTTVNDGIWATAMDLAEYDGRLIRIIRATKVVVSDPRYGRKAAK